MARYTWSNPPAVDDVSSFVIEKSTDRGVTFELVQTIDADVTDTAVYDPAGRVYFWEDPDPVPGEIVRIAAENDIGVGAYSYSHTPALPPAMCNIYGTIIDPIGGRPVAAATVRVLIFSAPLATTPPSTLLKQASTQQLLTDHLGRWSVSVMHGAVVDIDIPATSTSYTIRVPPLDVLAFADAALYRTGQARQLTGGRGGGIVGP